MYQEISNLMHTKANMRKEAVVKNSSDNEMFMKTMAFLMDDSFITGIGVDRWEKAIPCLHEKYNSQTQTHYDRLEFIKNNDTGRDDVLEHIKWICEMENTKSEKEIYEIDRGIFTKSLKVGMTKKTWNKIVEDTYKVAEELYMGLVSYSESKIDKFFKKYEYGYSQIKEDGRYLWTFIKNGKVFNMSARSGRKNYLELSDFALNINTSDLKGDYAIAGEVLIEGFDRKTANGIVEAINSAEEKRVNKDFDGYEKACDKILDEYGWEIDDLYPKMIYKVWDVLPLDHYYSRSSNIKYSKRLKRLISIVDLVNSSRFKVVDTRRVESKKEAMEHLAEAFSKGLEGTALKADEMFKNGKPAYQIKMKVEFDIDLEIVGFKEGKTGTANQGKLGSLICQTSDGIMKTGVSGGISKDQRQEIWDNQDDYLGRIVKVKCNGMSQNKNGGKSCNYASLEEFRDDKLEANTYQECLDEEQMALGLKSEI